MSRREGLLLLELLPEKIFYGRSVCGRVDARFLEARDDVSGSEASIKDLLISVTKGAFFGEG
jgi:hypothetical protein